jgi:hypothetical protein
VALDIRKLRTAAAKERKGVAKAQRDLVVALEKAATLKDQGGTAAGIKRAEATLSKAAANVSRFTDYAGVILKAATPDEVLASLERDIPIVLLPVRLETRVLQNNAGNWELRVRVYPDGIHSDVHEQDLIQPELDAGLNFWATLTTERGAAWQALVASFGAQRAAWVAEATRTDPQTRKRVWQGSVASARFTRPAWTEALPDKFLFKVRADGTDLPLFEGARVVTPLPLGPDPRLPASADDGSDVGMRWMTDFKTAENQGVGARIALGAAKPKLIDSVTVFGVKASLAPLDAAAALGRLASAHRYSDGLEVLQVGTPTNSSPQEAAGFSSDRMAQAEKTPADSGYSLAAGSDGARLGTALGIGSARMAGARGADAAGEGDAQAMLTALWPGTLGYFIGQMVAGSISEDEAALLRAHTVNWVRARGPLAPLRVGRNPYGVLPVTSLNRFVPDAGRDPGADRFVHLLTTLNSAWMDAAAKLPKVGRGKPQDSSKELAEILGLSPTSTLIDVRRIYKEGFVEIITALAGMTTDQQATVRSISRELVQNGFSAIGKLKDEDGLIAMVGTGERRPVTIDRVQKAATSRTKPLVDDYLSWLRSATPADLAAAEEKYGAPLLYLLARYALLRQYARAAATAPNPPVGFDPESILDKDVIVDIPGGITVPTLPLDTFVKGVPGVPGSGGPQVMPFGQALMDQANQLSGNIAMGSDFGKPLLAVKAMPAPGSSGARARRSSTQYAIRANPGEPQLFLSLQSPPGRRSKAPTDPGTVETAQVLAALEHLEHLPSATLDHLLSETLDIASHRLDAWVTSLATMRLSRMRADKPTGAHIGAYGHVEALIPAEAAAAVKPPGSPQSTDPALATDNQGFIPAPTMGHAATAAVLRSAHAAHGDGKAFAATLESSRVRPAKRVLDGVRQGQSLSALLGYELERALQDAGVASAIAKLRDVAPLRTSGQAPPAGASFEVVAPRDVVDGLKIARDEFSDPGFSNAERPVANAQIAQIRDTLDAVGDLLLAEGVHQLVAGTPDRAAAAARAAAGTGMPPEHFDVITTPRSGTALTHRVLLVAEADSSGWLPTGSATPRASADPMLENWAGERLGRPNQYAAVVIFMDDDGKKIGDPLEVRLEPLGLAAVDAVAMSARPETGQLCELERRILDFALDPAQRPSKVPVSATAAIADRTTHDSVSSRIFIRDLTTAAAAIGELFAACRVAAPHELDKSIPLGGDAYDVADLSDRLAVLVSAVEDAAAAIAKDVQNKYADQVDLDSLIAHLRAASWALPSALPEVADPAGDHARETLVTQARGILTELERREALAADMIAARSLGSGTEAAVTQRQEIARVLVDKLPPMMPRMRGSVADAMQVLVGQPPAMGAATTNAQRESAVRAFLAHARGVRKGVARLAESEAMSAALGMAPVRLRVTQTGVALGDPWVAVPGNPVPGGVVSTVMAGTADFAGANGVGAIAVDDWTEVVPRTDEVAALAVNTNRPGAEAPQSILIAVPPDPAAAWSVDSLHDVLQETFAQAEARLVDPPALDRYGQLLPALLLACTGREAQIKVPEKKFFPKVRP